MRTELSTAQADRDRFRGLADDAERALRELQAAFDRVNAALASAETSAKVKSLAGRQQDNGGTADGQPW